MASRVEYAVLDINEDGDAWNVDLYDKHAEAVKAYDACEIDDETTAVVLEKRKHWTTVRRPGQETEYQVLKVKGDVESLDAGGWKLQDELEPA